MPLSVEWTPKIITIPQSELTLISGSRYKITVDYYWQLLREANWAEEGIPFDTMYSSTAGTPGTPQIVDIINGYTVQFEDGQYSVEFVDGNTNFRAVEIKNQVSVGTNNVSGFTDLTDLEANIAALEAQIAELWALSGLDATKPMTVTPSQRVAGDIDLAISGDGLTNTTVQRQ